MKFWFDTDSTEWRELVPRQRIGDCSKIHVLGLGLFALLLSARGIDLFWFFAEVSNEHCASVFVSPLFEASQSESEFSLSQ